MIIEITYENEKVRQFKLKSIEKSDDSLILTLIGCESSFKIPLYIIKDIKFKFM